VIWCFLAPAAFGFCSWKLSLANPCGSSKDMVGMKVVKCSGSQFETSDGGRKEEMG